MTCCLAARSKFDGRAVPPTRSRDHSITTPPTPRHSAATGAAPIEAPPRVLRAPNPAPSIRGGAPSRRVRTALCRRRGGSSQSERFLTHPHRARRPLDRPDRIPEVPATPGGQSTSRRRRPARRRHSIPSPLTKPLLLSAACAVICGFPVGFTASTAKEGADRLP